MDENSKAYLSGESDDFFNVAEVTNLVEEDFVEYSKSYAKMEETERALQYAVKESYYDGFSKWESVGFSKGESVGIRKTAVNLKKMGLPINDVAKATGLSKEEIRML